MSLPTSAATRFATDLGTEQDAAALIATEEQAGAVVELLEDRATEVIVLTAGGILDFTAEGAAGQAEGHREVISTQIGNFAGVAERDIVGEFGGEIAAGEVDAGSIQIENVGDAVDGRHIKRPEAFALDSKTGRVIGGWAGRFDPIDDAMNVVRSAILEIHPAHEQALTRVKRSKKRPISKPGNRDTLADLGSISQRAGENCVAGGGDFYRAETMAHWQCRIIILAREGECIASRVGARIVSGVVYGLVAQQIGSPRTASNAAE